MDYIFGSNQQHPPNPKPKERELRETITLKEQPQKDKELTALQKIKIEQKRKLLLEKIQNQFDDMYSDGEQENNKGQEGRQLYNQNQNNRNYDYQANYDKYMQPITHLEQEPITHVGKQIQSSKQPISTPIKQQKSLIKQTSQNQLNKNISSPKPSIKQQNSSKLQSPPKISKQTNLSPNKNQKNLQSPAIKSRDIRVVKETAKPQIRTKIRQQANQQPSSSVKMISLEKKLSQPKLISSEKKISPKKELKVIKEQRVAEMNPGIFNKASPKPTRTLQSKLQPKRKGFSKQQKPLKSALSITQAQEEIRNSIREMKQSKQKQPQPYDFAHQSIDPESYMEINALLQGQLARSERGMRFLDKKLIGDRLSDMDNLVYNALTSSKPDEYLKGVYHNIYPDNQFIKSQVDDAVNGALHNINKLIVQQPSSHRGLKVNIQQRIAPKHKDDLKELQKLDKFRLIKIKQGQVKSKVGDLRHALQKEYYMNKNLININTSDLVDTDYYAMDHPQTIKAQNLIKQINQRRKSQHRNYKQILTQKQQQKQRIKQIQKEYQSYYNQQRKQKLRQFYQQKHLQREQQKQQLKQKQQQFKDWIKIYEREKPLQDKMQEQMVMKFIVPEIQERHKKLMKIKQEHKPIDIQEINQHDYRYMEYKRDQKIRLKAHLQNKAQEDHSNEDQVNRHYKGKYRFLVLESMYEEKNMTDPKDIQRSKKERQLAYSDQVKYVHKSLIRKKQQQQEDARALIRRVRNHNGSIDSTMLDNQRLNRTLEVSNGGMTERVVKRDAETIDTYAEGIKNLNYAKGHVRQKLMNGEQKRPKIEFIQQRVRHMDYLAELRQNREQHSSLPPKQTDRSQNVKNRSTVILGNSRGKMVVNDLSTTNDVESLKARVDNLDERLKRKEFKLRNLKDVQAIADTQIQNDYVQAIHAKIKLVQKIE